MGGLNYLIFNAQCLCVIDISNQRGAARHCALDRAKADISRDEATSPEYRYFVILETTLQAIDEIVYLM